MKIFDEMPPQFEVIVGTYEQFTLGYKIDKIVNEYKMDRTFAMHTHLASVRGLASKKHYLASAAADNTVCLYDMRNRIENGKLTHHSDTVNCISFTPDASHVITGSKDGSLAIIRCGNWQIEKHWESPHKGFSVDTLAVHPTGKLAMTTGGDGVLRTWNLIKGRQAYATNLNSRWKSDAKFVSVLKWNPSGQLYVIGANKMLDVYSVATAGVEEQLSFDAKIVCAEFLDEKLIAVGLADGKLVLYDLEDNSKVEIVAHKARLRCMARDEEYLVTASSEGEIKVWNFTRDSLSMLSKANCDARILCMTLSMVNEGKKVEVEEEEEEEHDSEVEVVGKKIKGFVKMQRVIVEDEDEDRKTPKGKKSLKRNREDVGEEGKKKLKGVEKRKADEEPAQSPKKKKVENKKRKSLDNGEEVAKKIKIETNQEKTEGSGKKKKNRNRKRKLNSAEQKTENLDQKKVETVSKRSETEVDDKSTENKASENTSFKNKMKQKKISKKTDENMNMNKKKSVVKVEKKKKKKNRPMNGKAN